MNTSRISAFTLKPGRFPDKKVIRAYSRMKYGDPMATRMLAQLLLAKLLSNYPSPRELFEEESVAIASSAFGSIPTAARALTKELELLLEGEGLKLRRIKIQREQALDEVDYATLNHMERGAILNARKLSISKCDLANLKGRTLIVVDDLLATGRHEEAIKETLDSVAEVKKVIFLYIFEFSKELRYSNPMAESRLNGHQIKGIDDFIGLFRVRRTIPYLNARVVKFLLAEGVANMDSFKVFLEKLPLVFCENFYEAAVPSDMRKIRDVYLPVIEMLKESVVDRQIDREFH